VQQLKYRAESINLKLLKCASQEFVNKLLRYMNNIWDAEELSETG
jgi:hypothetical protein